MVAYVDEFKSRFRVEPICRALAESLDCGFIAPRGYRMLKVRSVSRMAARHEALVRDILEIRSDFFMAVYGYRKMHAQLIAQGWDPAEIGRDQVMNVMRELGVQDVRRGRTPVTTKPAKGTGGRPDLVERKFKASAPNRLHVADITYVRMADGRFGYTAFVTDVFARRIVGWACATSMGTEEPSLQALEQAIAWAVARGGTDGLVQDRARLAARTLPGPKGPGASDVPVGLVVELEAAAPVPGLQDTAGGGNRVLCKPSGPSRLTIRAEQKSGHFRGI